VDTEANGKPTLKVDDPLVTEIKESDIRRRWGASINPHRQNDAEDADNLDDNGF
jgi:hypothetical protein